MKIKVGFGYDVHQLAEGRDLWLGGVKIEAKLGLLGHSDADVLIHAICDAILGAANMRDIGFHFPNTDPRWKGADSKILLKEVCRLIREKGWEISNIDASLSMEKPKINPHIPKMQEVLSEAMNIPQEDISIKATTNEKLGYIGREEGANAFAVALIYKK
ncbi:2-C-methyl-D-erythritol 2,4-cyclodiphosphate synthase [Sporocytophaga myxococcoides]|uniref:2-C-methyl-D-erythritol 2,4-cyclodiphosphate synthase n=1 Tax=Sporocytophaga myxococcoides TaxID=153721 RepID=A0A098LAR4_9BACT|nr:2-C-methyl-D-erythritol 2,4-cyclodiphosphate synthase [Sporocytophaga myxococcoides]GAL84015.1 2-C-methyl-D-erythritol 2,4-cyclodiphosphate synthase [Sporocytophaga myxococcoides]